ncbi:MAG TPA: YraN family protein [Bryobacteraceae bacterium]|nr:YraN family protein [Bryobacteraceae bacterium]
MMLPLYRLADALRGRRRARSESPEAAHGRRGEDLAQRHLQQRGLTVVARNWRPRSGPGELDLVAWEGATLVFVEVKTRASDDVRSPESAVDAEKREHLRRAAREYARRSGVPWEQARFDIVSVVLENPPAVRWIRDAFRFPQTV